MSYGERITYFGETDFRNEKTKFGIKNKDRSRHVYVIGKTGMGKSTLLEHMAVQDILNGEGMCFVDPHGSTVDLLLEYVPEHRVKDIVYFAPFDTNYPISFNVMEDVGVDNRHLVVDGLMSSFKKIWQDAWSARMEYILTNTLLALLEYPNSTLLGVNRMLAEKDYRNEVLKHVTNASVKSFWIDEYGKWDPRYAREAGAAIQNKIGQFTANPLIRNIIGQEKSAFDIREIMDTQKILLINLSKGRIGEQNANLLGGMLITKIYLAAMSRAQVGAQKLERLPNFFFFVDEFQNFANESFADILSEARKYKLNLTIAHQYVAQMEEEVRDAVIGNVGTMITFRIGAEDAELFEKQFSPVFTAEDIVNLGKFQVYLSLMVDGVGSRPFSARILAPVEKPPVSMSSLALENSRLLYAHERNVVEEKIEKWYQPVRKIEKRSFEKTSKKVERSNIETQKENNQVKESLQKSDNNKAKHEMKQIVSSKLSDLLNKIDHPENKTKQENPATVYNVTKEAKQNIQRYESRENKTKLEPFVKKEVKHNERSADKETMSSLQKVLRKATQNTHVKKVEKQKSQLTQKKVPAQRDNAKQSKKEQQQSNTISNNIQKKEVPEDVLRGIFN